jgi:D-alanyl-D-alanine carboxypeptidase/D-alanyl-D-alanine-endopeptidase (penicillin-binding protein 4)
MSRIVVFAIVGWLAAAVSTAAAGPAVAAARSTAAARAPRDTTLTDLAARARAILGAGQGVYVEAANGEPLLAQAAAIPVHPASVSKVPTTLALLRKLGPDYRFVTTFATNGRLVGNILTGDLLVESSGNPSLVDEDALLVADRMMEMGIHQVSGDLKLHGQLIFDWQPDDDGARLRSALSGSISPGALATVRAFELEHPTGAAPNPSSLQPQGIRFGSMAEASQPGSSRATTGPQAAHLVNTSDSGSLADERRVLITHRSQPLLALAKSLNDYSNNIFKPLADQAGGAAAVETVARGAVPQAMRSEITLGDGAGTDPRNRLSPRVAVKLLRALEEELHAKGHELFDILPVAGIDDGTLRHRLDGPEEAGRVVGKTGTFGDYGASALVGAISTTDRGTVYFAILNHNVPVPEARRRQDRFVRALLGHLHTQPWSYQRDARPAIARTEVLKHDPM